MTEDYAWSHGGRGGTTAVLEDLERATGVLSAAATEVDQAARALAVAAHVAAWHATAAPLAGDLARDAAGTAVEADRLRQLSTALRVAAAAYLTAECIARDGLAWTTRVGEAAGDYVGTVAWAHRVANGAAQAVGPAGLGMIMMGRNPAELVTAHGTPPVSAWANRDSAEAATRAVGERFDAVARTLAAALAEAESTEERFAVARITGRWEGDSPDGVADLIARLSWLNAQGGGTVAIETVETAQGRRHLVYVPGTQDWGVTDPNPADLQANLASITGDASDAARSVASAMHSHGILPDEPVLIAGHSQGGMIAMVAATALADRYAITHVVTAGAPTGRLTLPRTVEALHLENTRDPVPGLDARANPDVPHRVTVSQDRRRAQGPGRPDGSRTLAQSHGLPGYAATARTVDRGLSASTRAWVGGASGFLGGGPTQVTTYRPLTVPR
ncbi:MAG: lipase family protein [Actinomycetes bacterium]